MNIVSFVLGLLTFGSTAFAQTAPEVETLRLELETLPDILSNRLNPP